ncbi:MAG: helix-turn-helix domain-containing protein [Haloarculaceae archaeon]
MRAEWLRSDVTDGDVQVLARAEGGDRDRLEASFAVDPTLAAFERLADSRIYQATLAGEAREVAFYPTLVETGGLIRDFVGDHRGWYLRTAFPDRSAHATFHEHCRGNGLEIDVERVYETDDAAGEDGLGLTRPQRELLSTALQMGYFEIPRESTLAAVAAELDISPNAASERFRRAVRTLVEGVVRT